MPRYKVSGSRTVYYEFVFEIEADDEQTAWEDAADQLEDMRLEEGVAMELESEVVDLYEIED